MQSSSQIVTSDKSTPNFLQAECPSCHPTNSFTELKGNMKNDIILRLGEKAGCYYAALLPRRGPHIASHSVCLSVRLSVRPSHARMYFVYICTVLRANIQNRKTSVFAYGPASHIYFSARAEGRISYGHLGRTNSCLTSNTSFCSQN